MKADLKEKWVAALRSGNYKQGKNVLKRNGAYCCLGVLCEVAGDAKLDHDGNMVRSFNSMNIYGEVNPYLGLSGRLQKVLASHNDGSENKTQKNFKEIADLIDDFVEVTNE